MSSAVRDDDNSMEHDDDFVAADDDEEVIISQIKRWHERRYFQGSQHHQSGSNLYKCL